jgi:hypothetical protein
MHYLKITHPLHLTVCLIAASSCSTGKVKPNYDDATPPEISLSVTALDPEDQSAKSVSAPPGSSYNLPATENTDIIIVASAEDPGGIKSLRIWNIGADLKDMSKGEVLGTMTAAFKNVTAQAIMVSPAGLSLGVFAEAQNFGSGTSAQTTTRSGAVVLPVSGVPQPQYTGSTGKTTLTFSWDPAVKAYVSPGVPSPGSGTKVVGVHMSNPFGTGIFTSLYRGSGSVGSLDLRADFFRVWQLERTNQFNGAWSAQPWHLLRGNSQTGSASISPTVEVRWQKP